MPVTVYPALHGANEIRNAEYFVNASTLPPLQLLYNCPDEYKRVKNGNIIQSTFTGATANGLIRPDKNGFVNGAATAYNQHHHLEIRPEDVWFTILTQFGIYVNANSEDLRSHFVQHEGQKQLVIEVPESNIYAVNWGKFSYDMSKKLEDNIKDPSLREWIMPAFTTTTKDDQAVAAVLMMATLQEYFSFGCMLACGLPSVTLLGERSDWEEIAKRAERLPTFGKEPTQWHTLLKPVLSRFVTSFDAPDSAETKDFWQKIAHYSGGGSGPTYLKGWITAFCFWSSKGKPPYLPQVEQKEPFLEIDLAKYPRIDTEMIPHGWASVPIKVMGGGTDTMCQMVAGSLALKTSESGKTLHGEIDKRGLDTIAPVTGWLIYEKIDDEVVQAEEERKEKEQADNWEKTLEDLKRRSATPK